MGVIESLQSKCEEEEGNSESEEEAEVAPENLAVIAEDADDENLKEDILKPENPEGQVKVENDEIENAAAAETKMKANNKRKNCNDINAPAVVDAGVAAKGGKRIKVAAAT